MKYLLLCITVMLPLCLSLSASAVSIYDNNNLNFQRVFNPAKTERYKSKRAPRYKSSRKRRSIKIRPKPYYSKRKNRTPSGVSQHERNTRAGDNIKQLAKKEIQKKDYKHLSRDEVRKFSPAREITSRAK